MKRLLLPLIIFCSVIGSVNASKILIPMDEAQKNHLKAYGIAYWVIRTYDTDIDWLLNYRGGSFMMDLSQRIQNEMVIRGVSFEVISDAQSNQILALVAAPDANMDNVKLQKAPKVAVYSPKTKQPWDDAVTLVMTYAEIPYEIVYDDEVMQGKLAQYDWLHLHHEDFTGQYGKFYQFKDYPWYRAQKSEAETIAAKWGFKKVSKLKLAVAQKVREYVAGGGYMFAMCNATDTYDVALAAENTDIAGSIYDGDGTDGSAQSKLDFTKSFAFQNYKVVTDPYEVEFSSVDNQVSERGVTEANDYFTLFQFSAKYDPVPTMLTQNHQQIIKGFMGQTTAFKKKYIKPEVIILAENRSVGEAKYIHGTFAKGFFTFYGGHDPEDYQHQINEEPTDLNLHPTSAGYRLILNNILFPAAKKKKLKT
jgi:hypothetical protein